MSEHINGANIPKVFISYSHDSEDHKGWVLQLATRLNLNSCEVTLDQWDLRLGSDLPLFMSQGLSKSHRVICVCSEKYIEKANNPKGGVGFESMIMTAKLMEDLASTWIIPLVRNNKTMDRVPTFLKSKVYIDFNDDANYESSYEILIRDLLDEQVTARPPIGSNPFKPRKPKGKKLFTPGNEKYLSPALQGRVTFSYSNNDGRYTIGQGKYLFETCWSRAGATSIHIYSDPDSIASIAHANLAMDFTDISDASRYDSSSRTRTLQIAQIGLLENVNGYYAAVKVVSIRLADHIAPDDEITFEYRIQPQSSDSFSED